MKLGLIAKKINADLIGDINKEIHGVSFKRKSKKNIIYISNAPKDINPNEYGAVLTSFENKDYFPNSNILISKNPKLSFALLTSLFSTKSSKAKINKTFSSDGDIFCGTNVYIGSNFTYGCNVIIEDDVKIGDNVTVGHNICIHKGSIIGNNVTIRSGSIIGSEGFGNTFDYEKKWLHINHLGKVIINDGVVIGSNCTIDRGTVDDTIIHKGVIMDNQIHIGHNVEIGEYTAIAAKTGIAGSCVIGKRNLIGGMVGIVDHIVTSDDVTISATSTVNKNIPESGVYSGIFPILPHSLWKRVAFWVTKLDKIIKSLNINKL